MALPCTHCALSDTTIRRDGSAAIAITKRRVSVLSAQPARAVEGAGLGHAQHAQAEDAANLSKRDKEEGEKLIVRDPARESGRAHTFGQKSLGSNFLVASPRRAFEEVMLP